MGGSDKFSQTYDQYKILCNLAYGHALNMLEQYGLSVDKINAIIACYAEDICGRCCTSKK